MKNIVEVLRLKDNARRIYELPADMQVEIETGRLVDVDYGGTNSTALALVTAHSRMLTETEEATLRSFLHISGEFSRVRRVYSEPVNILWSDEYGDSDAPDGATDAVALDE